MRQLALTAGFIALAISSQSCSLIYNGIRARSVIEKLQTTTPNPAPPPFLPMDVEVTTIVRRSLPDGYWDNARVAGWVTAMGTPDRLTSIVRCVVGATTRATEEACFYQMERDLNLPAAPALDNVTEQAWEVEEDAHRLLVNLRATVHGIAAYQEISQVVPVDQNAPKIRAGLQEGLQSFADYQRARHVQRGLEHPITTFVLSGGAANGAFSAGAMWWLLSRLDLCKADAERGQLSARKCVDDHVDMVAGTSTGALISLVVKDYFSSAGVAASAQPARRRALDKLREAYVCSSNGALYCATDSGMGDLGLNDDGKARGLVRFNGVAKLLNGYVTQETFSSLPELFSTSVEFVTGRTNYYSSRDKRDVPDLTAFKESVMASIVEPALAEPLEHVGDSAGLLIDGGVRSGLPMHIPLSRGAERAVVFVNAPLEARPLVTPPPHAVSMLFRALELFGHQPIVGELAEAELALEVRREEERQICVDRMRRWDRDAALHLSSSAEPEGFALETHTVEQVRWRLLTMEALCSGTLRPGQSAPAEIAHSHYGSMHLRGAAASYSSTRLFEPHDLPASLSKLDSKITWDNLNASFYEFDPKAMGQTFAFGAAVAQQRCAEVIRTMGWHLQTSARDYCGSEAELIAALRPVIEQSQKCEGQKKAVETCGPQDVIDLTPTK
jgi:predicted acylesterase/phospholipase RssA